MNALPRRTANGPDIDRSWTVAELLAWTNDRFERAGIEFARLDAEWLLANALECTRLDLYLRHDVVVSLDGRARLRELVRRRLNHEPVAYIEGKKAFHALDLELFVDARVLVPRPETEHLVDWVLERLRPPPAPVTHVLDVGTGSGAIALAVKHARPDVHVVAVDIDADALEVARHNRDRLGLDIELSMSDLLANVAVPGQGFAAVAGNLPYVPSHVIAGLAADVRDHEPRRALDGGPDGLTLVSRLIEQFASRPVLASGGWLYLEVGDTQADTVVLLLEQAGFLDVSIRRDLAGLQRIVSGRWDVMPGPSS